MGIFKQMRAVFNCIVGYHEWVIQPLNARYDYCRNCGAVRKVV